MGKSVYFTDDELIELEWAMEGHGSSDEERKAVINRAHYKIGAALNRPWTAAPDAPGRSK